MQKTGDRAWKRQAFESGRWRSYRLPLNGTIHSYFVDGVLRATVEDGRTRIIQTKATPTSKLEFAFMVDGLVNAMRAAEREIADLDQKRGIPRPENRAKVGVLAVPDAFNHTTPRRATV